MSDSGARRVLAFVASDDGLRSFQRRAGEWQDCEVLLVLAGRPARAGVPVRCCSRPIEEFVPREYYKQILDEFGDLATAWRRYEPLANAFRFDGVDLGLFSRFALSAHVVAKALVPMLAVRKAIAIFRPDLVLADAPMQAAVAGAGWPDARLLGHGRKGPRWRQAATAAVLSLVSLAHRFGVRVAGGKLARVLRRGAIGDGTVFIGDEQGFKSIEAVFKSAIECGHTVNLLKPLGAGVAQTDLKLVDGLRRDYFEAQLSWNETVRALLASLRALLLFAISIGSGRLAESYGPERRVLFPLLQSQLISYMAFNVPLAFIGHLAAHRVARRHQITKAVFSPASSWGYTAALNAFRARGILTYSYMHGLILEPLPYLSDADLSISLGQFDARFLSSLLPEQHCTFTSRARRPGIAAGAPKDEIVILPSRWNPVEERRFLRVCLEFSRRHREPLGASRIVIKVHPHASNPSIQEAVDLASLIPGVIVIHDELWEHLQQARVALCMSSTVVLECLALDVPFFLYDSPLHCPEGTLNGCLDEIVRFRSADDLERKLPSRMAAIEFNRQWRDRYFGSEVPMRSTVDLLFMATNSASVTETPEPETMSI